MLLSELLHGLEFVANTDMIDPVLYSEDIENICTSLSGIKNRTAFIAINGLSYDGHNLCEKAEELGARVIITEYFIPELDILNIVVADTRKALAVISSNFYHNPAEKLILTGITGTNGKTTTAYMIEHMLSASGKDTGIIGTVENKTGKEFSTAEYTTPEPMQLHNLFDCMRISGMSHAVMEVSSHALDQDRTYGLSFKLGVFTNITVDHLDYHKTFENYKRAKLKLFAQSENRLANADSPYSEDFLSYGSVKSFSLKDQNADFYAFDVKASEHYDKDYRSEYKVSYEGRIYPVCVKTPGLFNIYNSLAAFASGCILGLDPEKACDALGSFSGVRGRMENIVANVPFNIFIDFAHTPDGLLNLLQTARRFTKNKIILVFGCGGDRDKSKRPMMGKIAEMHADVAVVTSDNPRNEDPEKIISDILAGFDSTKNSIAVTDRREAIKEALSIASEGDTVLIAGKGHEPYQIIKDRKYAFDEKKIILDLIIGKEHE